MSSRLKRNLNALQILMNLTPKTRKKIVKKLPDDAILAIAEILKNELCGNVTLSEKAKRNLSKFKKPIRCIACKQTSVKKKRKLLIQHGGIVPAAVLPILAIAASLLGNIVMKK